MKPRIVNNGNGKHRELQEELEEVPRLNRRAVMMGSELLHLSSGLRFTVHGYAENLLDGSMVVILSRIGPDFNQVCIIPSHFLNDENFSDVGF